MPRRARPSRRLTIRALVATTLFGVVTGLAPTAAAAQPGNCPGRADGGPPPATSIVGGPRMAECGVVLPANAELPPDGLEAASWLLADQDSGQVLAANAPHSHQPPASIAKVLLAMVALRDLNPETVVTATREDTEQQGSRIGLVADGRYTVRDLIAALIVAPSADAANALSRQLGGKTEALKRVNNLAASLGALDTSITDPTGLDAKGMSTSAYDAALIWRQAMRNQNFAAATGSPSVQITPAGRASSKIVRSNDNELLATYEGATGGKAGFTDAAKNIYIGSAQRGGHRIVLSLLGASSGFDQAAKLLDYGFALTGAHTAPVGDLNNKAGAGVVIPQPPADGVAGGGPDNDPAAAQRVAMDRSMFGNVGGFVVALGALAVLAMFVLAAKRKADRAAAARRRRAQERKLSALDREAAAKAAGQTTVQTPAMPASRPPERDFGQGPGQLSGQLPRPTPGPDYGRPQSGPYGRGYGQTPGQGPAQD